MKIARRTVDHLVLTQSGLKLRLGGQSIALNEWRNTAMAEAHAAINEFLEAPDGYR